MKKINFKISVFLVMMLLFTTACSNTTNTQENIDSATANIMRLEKYEGD